MDERQSLIQKEYRGRINRVVDFIETHLEDNLSLEQLAGIANFSKFHFHRIFYGEIGETLFQFIQRLRVEKAANLLLVHPEKTITDITMEVGFSSSAAFARAFRAYFGISATEWRNIKNSNTDQTDSNTGKAPGGSSVYTDPHTGGRREETIENLAANIVTLKAMTIAYIRHTGPFEGNQGLFEELFGTLYRWARPRDLLETPGIREVVVYHDSPGLTDDDKLRISAGITVPGDTEVKGEIGKMTIPGGKYLLARFRPRVDEYGAAWNWVFSRWFPRSGYQPDDRPSFEMYGPEEKIDEEGRCIVDICVPVRPL